MDNKLDRCLKVLTSMEARKLKFGGCFVGVYRVSGGYLKGVWRVSGKCLEGFWGVSEGYLEFVSLNFMEGRKLKFSGCLLGV